MLKRGLFAFALILNLCLLQGQSIVNGNFSAGSTGWGCNPETNPESVYGGTGSNPVAEIDASAGRCQTIAGFTVGQQYILSFLCSRRTTCGPALQSMNVTVNGGALPPTSITRTGAFNFTQENLLFTATLTTHTITFAGTSAGTCGLIIDNVALSTIDLDSDNDGIPDVNEPGDTDLDGIPDRFDLDSDNDGIYDLIEAGHGAPDLNSDGLIDGPPSAFGGNGLYNALETSVDSGVLNYVIADSDGDGIIDSRELDSDNDGCNDIIEAGYEDPNGNGILGDD